MIFWKGIFISFLIRVEVSWIYSVRIFRVKDGEVGSNIYEIFSCREFPNLLTWSLNLDFWWTSSCSRILMTIVHNSSTPDSYCISCHRVRIPFIARPSIHRPSVPPSSVRPSIGLPSLQTPFVPPSIVKLAVLTCLSERRTICAMIQYIFLFIPRLSETVAPMNKLLKLKVVWRSGTAHEAAFIQVKTLIATAPVLAYYDRKLTTVVNADAASYGLGARLLQEHKGQLHSRLDQWRPVRNCTAWSRNSVWPRLRRVINSPSVWWVWTSSASCQIRSRLCLSSRQMTFTKLQYVVNVFSCVSWGSIQQWNSPHPVAAAAEAAAGAAGSAAGGAAAAEAAGAGARQSPIFI